VEVESWTLVICLECLELMKPLDMSKDRSIACGQMKMPALQVQSTTLDTLAHSRHFSHSSDTPNVECGIKNWFKGI
jgi:hypothetical protein